MFAKKLKKKYEQLLKDGMDPELAYMRAGIEAYKEVVSE